MRNYAAFKRFGDRIPNGWSRKFAIYFHFVGWDCFSLGLHLCATLPNVEIHLPFGFIRIGMIPAAPVGTLVFRSDEVRTFGLRSDV